MKEILFKISFDLSNSLTINLFLRIQYVLKIFATVLEFLSAGIIKSSGRVSGQLRMNSSVYMSLSNFSPSSATFQTNDGHKAANTVQKIISFLIVVVRQSLTMTLLIELATKSLLYICTTLVSIL